VFFSFFSLSTLFTFRYWKFVTVTSVIFYVFNPYGLTDDWCCRPIVIRLWLIRTHSVQCAWLMTTHLLMTSSWKQQPADSRNLDSRYNNIFILFFYFYIFITFLLYFIFLLLYFKFIFLLLHFYFYFIIFYILKFLPLFRMYILICFVVFFHFVTINYFNLTNELFFLFV
jgi:hypothetical protein